MRRKYLFNSKSRLHLHNKDVVKLHFQPNKKNLHFYGLCFIATDINIRLLPKKMYIHICILYTRIFTNNIRIIFLY